MNKLFYQEVHLQAVKAFYVELFSVVVALKVDHSQVVIEKQVVMMVFKEFEQIIIVVMFAMLKSYGYF